jgi:hypothetical protein
MVILERLTQVKKRNSEELAAQEPRVRGDGVTRRRRCKTISAESRGVARALHMV